MARLARWKRDRPDWRHLGMHVMARHESWRNLEIVRTMPTLGRTPGHEVIAEGIETEDQLAMLRQLGVREGQGLLPSRPMCADQVEGLAHHHRLHGGPGRRGPARPTAPRSGMRSVA